MARHVVGAFGRVAIKFRIARHEPSHERFQIGQDVGIGIFLDQQRRRGVAHKAGEESPSFGARRPPDSACAARSVKPIKTRALRRDLDRGKLLIWLIGISTCAGIHIKRARAAMAAMRRTYIGNEARELRFRQPARRHRIEHAPRTAIEFEIERRSETLPAVCRPLPVTTRTKRNPRDDAARRNVTSARCAVDSVIPCRSRRASGSSCPRRRRSAVLPSRPAV